MSVTETQQAGPAEQPEKGELRLPNLEIHHFRAFEHLQIEPLGRVNLITGRNNVGKTSLLEAVYLYAYAGAALPLWEILKARDEFGTGSLEGSWTSSPVLPGGTESPISLITLKHLFHGHKDFEEFPEAIRIGPVEQPDATLQLVARLYRVHQTKDQHGLTTPHFAAVSPAEVRTAIDAAPYLSVKMGAGPLAYYGLDQLSDRRSYLLRMGALAQDRLGLLVRAAGFDNNRMARLWDNANLSPLEDVVLECLRIIAPDTERVGVRLDPDMPTGRVPIIRQKGASEPVPLRTMGHGMVRLFGIAVALVNARDGFLLIDEVENGLHYSIQPDLWRLIFRVASRLNVQVFATTHSWDCIEAFQKATAQVGSEPGMLIRLREKDGKIVSTCFDEEDLAIVTRDNLEVR